MSVSENSLSDVHYHIVRGLIMEGCCPDNPALASRTGLEVNRLEEALLGLSAIHGLVLHPHVCRPWIVHPFSLTPTLNWIQGVRNGWWAPCVWCAFGVAALVGGDVAIYTRVAGETDPLVIPVRDGQPVGETGICVHFAIPPSRAWDNVHMHCSLVLPFRNPEEIPPWCERHQLPQGEAVSLNQVAALARDWYGRHADSDWRKWTMAQAQEIFHRAGLQNSFWDLGAKKGLF